MLICFIQLLKEFPVLCDYADCWPAAAILRRHHLHRTQQGPQSQGIVCSASRQVSLANLYVSPEYDVDDPHTH